MKKLVRTKSLPNTLVSEANLDTNTDETTPHSNLDENANSSTATTTTTTTTTTNSTNLVDIMDNAKTSSLERNSSSKIKEKETYTKVTTFKTISANRLATADNQHKLHHGHKCEMSVSPLLRRKPVDKTSSHETMTTNVMTTMSSSMADAGTQHVYNREYTPNRLESILSPRTSKRTVTNSNNNNNNNSNNSNTNTKSSQHMSKHKVELKPSPLSSTNFYSVMAPSKRELFYREKYSSSI